MRYLALELAAIQVQCQHAGIAVYEQLDQVLGGAPGDGAVLGQRRDKQLRLPAQAVGVLLDRAVIGGGRGWQPESPEPIQTASNARLGQPTVWPFSRSAHEHRSVRPNYRGHPLPPGARSPSGPSRNSDRSAGTRPARSNDSRLQISRNSGRLSLAMRQNAIATTTTVSHPARSASAIGIYVSTSPLRSRARDLLGPSI